MIIIILLSLFVRVKGTSPSPLTKQGLYALLSSSFMKYRSSFTLKARVKYKGDTTTVHSHAQAQLTAHCFQRSRDQPNDFVIPRVHHGRLHQQGVQAVQVSAPLTGHL